MSGEVDPTPKGDQHLASGSEGIFSTMIRALLSDHDAGGGRQPVDRRTARFEDELMTKHGLASASELLRFFGSASIKPAADHYEQIQKSLRLSAEEAAEEQVSKTSMFWSPDDPDRGSKHSTACQNLANELRLQGKSERAVFFLERALEFSYRFAPGEPARWKRNLTDLAAAQRESGQEVKAQATEKQLKQLKALDRNSDDPHEMNALFKRCWRTLDHDHKGYLSLVDIDRAIINPNLKGEVAQLACALKVNWSQLATELDPRLADVNSAIRLPNMLTGCDLSQNKLLDVLRLTDMDKFEKSATQQSDLFHNMQMAMVRYEQQLMMKHQLLSSEGAPIRPAAVVQGYTGDCFFLAALGSMAAKEPDVIKNMIKANGNGTYTVKFPQLDAPITVSRPTAAELAMYARDAGAGIWPAIAEKAYGKYQMEHSTHRFLERSFGDRDLPGAGAIPQDYLDGGSFQDHGLLLFTKSVDGEVWKTVNEGVDVLNTIKRTWDYGPLILTTWNTPDRTDKMLGNCGNGPATAYIDARHVVSILRYDRMNNKPVPNMPKGTFLFPLPGGHTTEYGVLKIRDQDSSYESYKHQLGNAIWKPLEQDDDGKTFCITTEDFTRLMPFTGYSVFE